MAAPPLSATTPSGKPPRGSIAARCLTPGAPTLPCDVSRRAGPEATGRGISGMPIWIPIAVAAALFQCWRTAMQQKLRNLLSVNGAGFVRYLYGMPTAMVLLVIALAVTGAPLPSINATFLLYCVLGGLCQIVATNLLIMSFGYRH